MNGLLKRPGYRLYSPDSPEARALLAEQGLVPADLDRALAHLERAEGTAVRTVVGINEDGVFGVARADYGLPAVVDDRLARESEIYLEGGDHTTLVRVTRNEFATLMHGAPTGALSWPQ